MNDDIQALLDRIAADSHTEADLATLRGVLLVGGQGNVVQVGKYNIHIGEGQDIRIGDTIYQLPRPEPEIDLAATEVRYRRAVVQQYDRLDLSGVLDADSRKSDEPDRKLSQVALQDIFIHLSLTVRKVIVQREEKQNKNVQHGEKQNEDAEKQAEKRKEQPPQPGELSRRHQTNKNSRLREKPAEDRRSKDAETPVAGLRKRPIDPGASSPHADAEKESKPQQERVVEVKQPITLAEALSQDALIIGEPGAGKSTLLRWLAVTYAQGLQRETDRLGVMADRDRVPVYIALGQLPPHYQEADERQAPDWRSFLPAYVARQPGMATGAEVLIRQALTEGRCLLLFDGLDEIADRQARARVARSIAQQFGDGNRVVVGSRPGGLVEVEGALLPRFRRCQIERFTEEQIHQFFRFWYSQDESLSEEKAQAQAMELFGDLQKRPEVLKLAQTPLLATIILVNWRSEGRIRLPRRRTELYERCCELLIRSWESNHDVAYAGVLKDLEWDRHLRLLAPLAFTIHAQGQRTSAPASELLDVLAQGLQAEGLCTDVGRARFEAEQFLRTLGVRSGLLQHLGGGEYSFPHLTFQEYLTARYIAEQSYPDYIDLLMAHLHEAWWSDVHVLTIGCLGNSQKDANRLSPLLLAILRLYPPPSRFLQPDFLFDVGRRLPRLQLLRRVSWLLGRELELTASGIWEAEPESISSEVNEAFDTLAWGYIVRHLELDPSDRSSQEGRRVSATLAKVSPRLVQQLADSLGSSTWMVRVNAAEILLDVGIVTKIAVERRVQALAYADGEDERHVAEEYLASLDLHDPIAVRELTAILATPKEDPEDDPWRMRWQAARLLGLAGENGRQAIPSLVAALHEWPLVGAAAAHSLGQLGYADTEVLQALVSVFGRGWDYQNEEVAISLAKLGALSPSSPFRDRMLSSQPEDTNSTEIIRILEVVGDRKTLLAAVLGTLLSALAKDDQISDAAVAGLVCVGRTDSRVSSVLARTVARHPWYKVRPKAAKALGALGQTSPEILDALVCALHESSGLYPGLATSAAESLGNLGVVTSKVAENLILSLNLRLGEVSQACSASIGALARTGGEAVRELLAAGLRSYQFLWDEKVDRIAAALNTTGVIYPQPVEALIDSLGDDDQTIGQFAARLLGKLSRANPAALPAIVQAVGSDSTQRRRLAVFALGISGTNEASAIHALFLALVDPDNIVRLQAAQSLGQLGYKNTPAIQVLREFVDASDWHLRNDAALALVQWGLVDSRVIEVLRSQLQMEDVAARSYAALILGDTGKSDPEVVSALLATLQDGQAIVREAACRSLGYLGASHPEIVHGLEAALDDPERDVRSAAVISLRQVKPVTSESTQALIMALKDGDWPVRWFAVQGLSERIESNPEIEFALAGALDDENDTVRVEAARCLASRRAVASQTAATMARATVAEQIRGQQDQGFYRYHLLRSFEPAKSAMPVIADAVAQALLEGNLKPDVPTVELLGRAGNPSPRVFKALIQACNSESKTIQQFAATSLGQLGHRDTRVIEALRRLANDEQQDGDDDLWSEPVQEAAVESLSKLGACGSLLLQPFLMRLDSNDYHTASRARDCLEKVCAVEPEAADLLVGALHSADEWVQLVGAKLLGKVRRSSARVVEALAAVLHDRDWKEQALCDAAADSLAELSQTNPLAAQALVEALRGTETPRRAAVKSLDKWAPLSAPIVAALTNDLGHWNSLEARLPPTFVPLHRAITASAEAWGIFVRRRDLASGSVLLGSLVEAGLAVLLLPWHIMLDEAPREERPGASWYALRNLRPSNPTVTDMLLQALDHRCSHVRSAVALALNELNAAYPQVRRVLMEALTSRHRDARLAAAAALSQSDHMEDPEVRLALAHALASQDRDLRLAVVAAFSQPNCHGDPEAEQALTRSLSDKDWEVRCLSAMALAQTGVTSMPIIRNLLPGLNHRDDPIRQKALEILSHIQPAERSHFIQTLALLVQRWHARYLSSDDPARKLIGQLVHGRPLPGYRWMLIREREARVRRLRQTAFWMGIIASALLVSAMVTWLANDINANVILIRFLSILGALVAFGAGIAQILGRSLNDPWSSQR